LSGIEGEGNALQERVSEENLAAVRARVNEQVSVALNEYRELDVARSAQFNLEKNTNRAVCEKLNSVPLSKNQIAALKTGDQGIIGNLKALLPEKWCADQDRVKLPRAKLLMTNRLEMREPNTLFSDDARAVIEDALGKKRPFQGTYCANIHYAGLAKRLDPWSEDECGNHAALIIGRRKGPDGRCQLLLRQLKRPGDLKITEPFKWSS